MLIYAVIFFSAAAGGDLGFARYKFAKSKAVLTRMRVSKGNGTVKLKIPN